MRSSFQAFADIVIDGEFRTAIRFAVEPQSFRGSNPAQ